MNSKTDFFEKVYAVVKQIPYGRVSTYGAIANYLGSKKSARVVGWAMNASHQKKKYTCPQGGQQSGLANWEKTFFGINLMKQLLENEGMIIDNNQIKNFNNFFGIPQKNYKIYKLE